MDCNGDFYNDFPSFKVLYEKFQTCCDEVNSQEKNRNVPKGWTSDNGPVSLLLYKKKIKTELKAIQDWKQSN